MSDENTNKAALYGALAKAQGEFEPIQKNQTGLTSSLKEFRFADLAAIIAATRPALAANGLAVVQLIQESERWQVLETVLVHEGGASIKSSIPINPPAGGDIKSYGAMLTYLRRYSLSALLNVAADEDLDAEPQAHLSERAPFDDDAADDYSQFYDQDLFDDGLPAWSELIESGKKTAEAVIATLESSHPLTDMQRDTLLNIEAKA